MFEDIEGPFPFQNAKAKSKALEKQMTETWAAGQWENQWTKLHLTNRETGRRTIFFKLTYILSCDSRIPPTCSLFRPENKKMLGRIQWVKKNYNMETSIFHFHLENPTFFYLDADILHSTKILPFSQLCQSFRRLSRTPSKCKWCHKTHFARVYKSDMHQIIISLKYIFTAMRKICQQCKQSKNLLQV